LYEPDPGVVNSAELCLAVLLKVNEGERIIISLGAY